MSTTRIYSVQFQVVKANTPPFSGKSHQYRRELRAALVSAAADSGILAVLNSNVTLAGAESIEVLSSSEVSRGTEAAVLT